jgi:hypothetical protein
MPRPWSAYDIAVGNDQLPALQFAAMLQRMRAAPPIPVGPNPMPPLSPTPRAPSANEPIALFPPRGTPRRRASLAVGGAGLPGTNQHPARRFTNAIAGHSPNERGQQYSPEERDELRASMLGGAAAGLQDLLAHRPGAGIGEMLLAAGTGLAGGRVSGERGIRLGRRDDLETRIAEEQLAGMQSKTQREAQREQRLQALLADPNIPDSQKRVLEWSLARVPAAGLEAMAGPAPMSEYQRASVAQRDRALGLQAQGLALARERIAQGGAARPTGLAAEAQALGIDLATPEGRQAYQQFKQGLERPGGGSTSATALERNTQFISKALGIPEKDAATMMLQSASGRKTPEQMEAEFAGRLLGNPLYANRPEEAAAAARRLRQAIEGETPAAPVVTEAPTSGGLGDWISSWFSGEEATAAPTQTAPTAGTELPMMGDGRRPDPSQLQVGTAYTLPNGEVATWDGQNFVVRAR